MHIKAVIEKSMLAIFSDKKLSKQLVLKGGGALQFLEKKDDRLSIDLDFSIRKVIFKPEEFFKSVEQALVDQFGVFEFDVIDFKYHSKPKSAKLRPSWWRGWLCQFKLSSQKYRDHPLMRRRRAALIPEGANSSNIEIEISEHEYCSSTRKKRISGIVIEGYSREAIVLEKMRAICQQHSSYLYSKPQPSG